MAKKSIGLINGPNLNLLGQRDEEQYGAASLKEIVHSARSTAKASGFSLVDFQSNSEGEIVDAIHKSIDESSGIIINPGAYSHTSIAIRDALECFSGPIIEVHLSNIYSREEFRNHSFISEVATGVISGFGGLGYELAVFAVIDKIQ